MRTNGVGRPPTGFGHYVRDMVFGALDGIITTLAVISGATGAALEPRVGLILGAANLVADGLSMGASNYLGLKSELEQTGNSIRLERPWRHGAATTGAFMVAGAAPLLAFAVPRVAGVSVFQTAALFAAIALIVAGGLRAGFVGKNVVRSAAEMVAVGVLASLGAYTVGAVANQLSR